MAGKAVKYWSKTNPSNPIPNEAGDGFVHFDVKVNADVGFLMSSDKGLNEYLETHLGSFGLRLLTKDGYEDSKKKVPSSGSAPAWREEIGGLRVASDSVTHSPDPSEQAAVDVANLKKADVFSEARGEKPLPESSKPKSGKRKSK